MPNQFGPERGGDRAGAGTMIIAGRRSGSDSTTHSRFPADLRDRRLQHDVARLHACGPRAVYELLVELAARRMVRFEIEELVGRYAQLDPATLRTLGAERFPPIPPLRLVHREDAP
jgi:hypothetical protein